jgi:hypothetical protein
MSKLHIYSSKDGTNKVADGDGVIPRKDGEEFSVELTWGSVSSAHTYWISQGQSVHRVQSECSSGAGKGGTAKFRLVQASLLTLDQEHLEGTLAMRAALAAVEKTVRIEIAAPDKKLLMDQGYRLCFAKKVGDAQYNVVWQSYTEYLAGNTFKWVPMYQIFGINEFKDAVQVSTDTNVVDIGLGETTTLDKYGEFTPAKTGGNETSINMVNDYGTISPCINQLSTGIKGEQVSTPIYVAPQASLKGSVSLQPVEKVLVWFEQNIETSTMFSEARTKSIEIDLTKVKSATRRYEAQNWVTP